VCFLAIFQEIPVLRGGPTILDDGILRIREGDTVPIKAFFGSSNPILISKNSLNSQGIQGVGEE